MWRKWLRKTTAIVVVLSAILSLVIIQFRFDYIEALLFDLRIRSTPSVGDRNQIALVMVDTESVASLGRLPNLSDYADLLTRLDSSAAQAFLLRTQLDKIPASPKDRAKFSRVAGSIPRLVLNLESLEMKGVDGKGDVPSDLRGIQAFRGVPTLDKVVYAKDGVTRRMMIAYQEQPMTPWLAAQLLNPNLPPVSELAGVFPVFDSDQAYIRWQAPKSFLTLRWEDVLNGNADLSQLKGRLVILGDDLGKAVADYVTTPYMRDTADTSNAELTANEILTVLNNSSPKIPPPFVSFLFTFLVSLVTLYAVMTLQPVRGMMVLGATAMATVAIGWIAFWPFSLLLPLSQPLLVLFATYYFFIPYRLIQENRRSWEYYQKNQLLKSVEELKTNFISMMSHDLKTPLARIQGMTAVIAKDAQPLSSTQADALDTIRSSSADLLSMISSILNYARIESQGVELHKTACDINTLVTEVIRRHDFLAQIKHIKIESKLDPLFSLKCDPDLVRQIVANLVENAIKYSPARSTVWVNTQEVNSTVEIEIIDQGPGVPPEDQEKIFMKFFRSQNAKTSQIKGSGLGLYLAKYFTELHGGSLELTSEVGKGSRFVVHLPMG